MPEQGALRVNSIRIWSRDCRDWIHRPRFDRPPFAQGASCTGGGKITKQIAKPMAAAQDAQKAKKWQEVLAKTREAEAAPAPSRSSISTGCTNFAATRITSSASTAEAARELESGLNNRPACPKRKKPSATRRSSACTPRCATIPRSSTTAIARSRLSRDPETAGCRGARRTTRPATTRKPCAS